MRQLGAGPHSPAREDESGASQLAASPCDGRAALDAVLDISGLSQFARQDSEILKSSAMSQKQVAVAITSHADHVLAEFTGIELGHVAILPAAPLGTTDQISPEHFSSPVPSLGVF
jgi:hypothetical protein